MLKAAALTVCRRALLSSRSAVLTELGSIIRRRHREAIKPLSRKNQAFGKVFWSPSQQCWEHLGKGSNKPEALAGHHTLKLSKINDRFGSFATRSCQQRFRPVRCAQKVEVNQSICDGSTGYRALMALPET